MAMPVLATKLFVPLPRPQAVPRPRLVERLDEGIRSGSKLTLISAPAGFGKTTLLSEWIASARRRDPQARVAWLSLDESDNDPARFLSYLVASLQGASPDVGKEGQSLQVPDEATLTALINDIALVSHQIVLVLDDLQLIEDASIRTALVFLLDHLPPNLHVAVASRSDPLLPVARMRARGELTELRASDLRFTSVEVASFLNEVMHLALSPEDVDALEARTEGWIAGLQLAALSMRDRSDVSAFITGFTGSHRFVIDYLAEEVLQLQPDSVRRFLFHTSILDRLSGPLCDAVTGQSGGGEMLESLERDNLFVVPLDDRREWHRYHHLFADMLAARLRDEAPGTISSLHRRASEWYEVNGYPDDAVRHALAARDFERAARVIESTIPGVRKSRQDSTLLRWLTQLPAETIERRPVLSVFSAWSSLVSGDIAAVEPWLAQAERLLSMNAHQSTDGEELRRVPVTIALYRAAAAQATGDLAGIKLHAQRALDLTAPDDHLGRGAAAGLLGLASWASGDLEAGVRAFAETRDSLLLAGNLTDALSTTMVLSDMLLPLGRLRDAQRAYDDALRQSIEHGNGGQPTADLHAGISELFRERNQLAAATEHLMASEALGEGAFSHEHRYRWFVAMARVREAEGQLDASLDLLASAEQHYLRGFFPEVRPIGGMKARIWISQGRFAQALAWVAEQGLSATDQPNYVSEFGHITLARLGIAQGHDATDLLGRLLEAAEAGRRTGSVNEILVLQALALASRGQVTLALGALGRALEQAESEGYVRLFLDEGAPMAALLRAAAEAGIRPEYVRRLSPGLGRADGVTADLPEPLSERELHVLTLLATELTGPEIARELYVSLNTMRTHTKHIFGKLDVNSRPAAVRRATELGLI